MNEPENIVVGVDFGTTKICAVVASRDDQGRVNVLGVGVADSEGLNRGVVVNIDKTVDAVQRAVGEAERAAGVETRAVVVGIAGDHIQSFQSRGVITISNRDGEITPGDVRRLLEDTRKVAIPADREILHTIPQEFIVDGQDGVADPVGMSGVRLEASVHIITGLTSAAKNVYRCIERAGYRVADIVLEPLASSSAVLHPDEREIGVDLTLNPGTSESLFPVVFGSGDWDIVWVPIARALPSSLVQVFSGPTPPEDGLNFAYVSNPEYDELVTAAAAKLDVSGCPEWEAAEKALITRVDVVPVAISDSPVWGSGGVRFFVGANGIVRPMSVLVVED